MNKHHEAGKFLREALSIRKQLYPGGIHPEVARTLWLLGLNYLDSNEQDKANHVLHEANHIMEKCEGYDSLKSSIKESLNIIIDQNNNKGQVRTSPNRKRAGEAPRILEDKCKIENNPAPCPQKMYDNQPGYMDAMCKIFNYLKKLDSLAHTVVLRKGSLHPCQISAGA